MQAIIEWPTSKALDRLSGAGLKGALIAGAGRVLSKRDDLNRINVFPVPDGDTGTNLAFTMVAVLKTVRRLRGADVSTVLGGVAREAIDGARGNSGAILAQFFKDLQTALGAVGMPARPIWRGPPTTRHWRPVPVWRSRAKARC